MYVNTEQQTFLHLRYLDIINRSHDEYYQVTPLYGSHLISSDVGRALFEEASPSNRVNLRDLTVDKIAPKLEELIKKQSQ
jgi:hypothetical protein